MHRSEPLCLQRGTRDYAGDDKGGVVGHASGMRVDPGWEQHRDVEVVEAR